VRLLRGAALPQMLAFATQQASLLQQALPFMLPVCPTKVSTKLAEVLEDKLGARGALSDLLQAGYTEQQAQRAALDYYQTEPGGQEVPLDGKKLLKWVNSRPNTDFLNRWVVPS